MTLAGARSRMQNHTLISIHHWLIGHEIAVSMLVVGILALLPYGRSLGFGFFNDDPSGNFAWMEYRTVLQLFTSSEGYGFYRPLGFLVWKGLHWLLGWYNPVVFHAALLLIHGANVALAWLLARFLARSTGIAWCATVLYATFPLHYEAVVYVASFFHPLLVFWVLATLILYYAARLRRDRRYLWAAQGTLILGLLTHENGIVTPLLILALECAVDLPRSFADLKRRPVWPFFVAPALFLLVWWRMPKALMGGLQAIGELGVKLNPFLQALGYPLMPVFSPSVFDVPGLWILGLLTLTLTYLAAWYLSRRRYWGFGMAWFLVTTAPALLFLKNDYLRGSPRLYYLPAVGVAILWSLCVVAAGKLVAQWSKSRIAAWAVQAIVLLAIALPPIPFVACQTDIYARASSLVRQVVAEAKSSDQERSLIFVNLPFFFTSYPGRPDGCRSVYPHVNAGAIVFPLYARLSDFIRINGGPSVDAIGATVAEYDAGWPPRYGEPLKGEDVRNRLGSSTIFVFDTQVWSFWNLSEIWNLGARESGEKIATFGDGIVLQAAQVQRLGDNLAVALEWKVSRPPTTPITAFVHVYDSDGKLIAQHDGSPGQNGAPVNYAAPSWWKTGDVIRDTHVLTLPKTIPERSQVLAVGLYDANTLQRLPVMSPEGKRLDGDLVRLEW